MSSWPAPDLGSNGDPLAALRGYHMPDPVAWWPPAPGWWLLLLLLAVATGVSAWWLAQRRSRSAAARHARYELARLRRELATDKDSARFVRQLSKLLRRYALAVYPREQVAALTGDDWLRFLDTHGGQGRFCDGPGRQLLDAPYRPAVTGPVEQLAALVDDWIGHNRDRRREPRTRRRLWRSAAHAGEWIGRKRPAVGRPVKLLTARVDAWIAHNRGRRT